MPGFQIVDSLESAKHKYQAPDWQEVHFKRTGDTVDEKGNPPAPSYKGRLYRLILKYEREYTCSERVSRFLFGIFALIFSLGGVLLTKVIGDFFTSTHEKVRLGIRVEEPVFNTCQHSTHPLSLSAASTVTDPLTEPSSRKKRLIASAPDISNTQTIGTH